MRIILVEFLLGISLFFVFFCTPTEDAKRLAIKEEQYDPGYEDAYGGAYVEKEAEGGQAETQPNGHCTFSSVANSGDQQQMAKPETNPRSIPKQVASTFPCVCLSPALRRRTGGDHVPGGGSAPGRTVDDPLVRGSDSQHQRRT